MTMMTELLNPCPDLAEILCAGKDGVIRTFFDEGPRESEDLQHPLRIRWRVHVRNPPAPLVDGIYAAAFDPVDTATLRSVEMDHFGLEAYREKGIPEQVILHAKHVAGKKIVSSSTGARPNEFRGLGHAVWVRLLEMGLATFNKDLDRFETT